MRLPAVALLAASLLVPSLAHAGRFTAGVALGRTQAEVDATSGFDASSTAALWLRAGLGKRFGADLELGKISTENEATRVRTVNLVGRMTVADLRGGTIHPMALVGLGVDSTSGSTSYHHVELGAAIELDLATNFVLGADFRFGDRTADVTAVDEPLPGPVNADGGPRATFLEPSALSDGAYRAGRLYLGVRL